MKAAPFDYRRVTSIDEACRALADGGDDARLIAGGQTLVPLMAMRLARPTLLIDINGIAEMSGIAIVGGHLVIGAGTRQAEILDSPVVKNHLPLLTDALSHVGHDQTRNRGTIGGSLANADPAAELPLIAKVLDAEMVARSVDGTRTIAAASFFESAMATALAANECLTEIRFPLWQEQKTGYGFHEVSIRDSDFALAAAAVQLTLDNGGACTRLHMAIGGASPAPMRLGEIEAALMGTTLDDSLIHAETARLAALVDPQGDIHADAAYRRRVARVLTERALLSARDRAIGANP
ncbi:MAG: xanthine dehydrogenase family protein subunit M [Proteobacteria bacterium]|nr:xanthine dehydrogenase family protein subunit M [Pseudomonadota bacterium]